MTKMIKWWARISFWNKIRSALTAVGIGSEFALFMFEIGEGWKWFAGLATLMVIGITHIVEDANGDGEVDIFEDGKE